MNRCFPVLVIMVSMLVYSVAGAAEKATAPMVEPKNKTEMETITVPPGMVVIEEDILFVFDDEPYDHFVWAKDYFNQKNMKLSAREIRRAAGFLKLESHRAMVGDGKIGLELSNNELNQLAGSIEKSSVTSEPDLTKKFAIAHRALANHFSLKAEEALKAKNDINAGRFLDSAASNIEHAYKWAGQEIGTGEVTLRVAHDLALRLIEGSAKTDTEAEKVLAGIKTELNNLDKKLK
jgi:hypothetical protein